MKTLQDVVLIAVQELNKSNQPFSAHDVTRQAREHVNNSSDQFNLLRGMVDVGTGQQNSWVIDHHDVNTIVRDMANRDELTRSHNGTYFTYRLATQPQQTFTPTTNRSGITILLISCICDTIGDNYLPTMPTDFAANMSVDAFMDKYGIDSLDWVEIIMSIEEMVDTEIDEADIVNASSINEFVELIAKNLSLDIDAAIDSNIDDAVRALRQRFQLTVPPVISSVNSSVTSQQILDYLERMNKKYRRSYPRSIKNIQSMLKQKGTKSKDLINIITADSRIKFTRQGTTIADTFVEVA